MVYVAAEDRDYGPFGVEEGEGRTIAVGGVGAVWASLNTTCSF